MYVLDTNVASELMRATPTASLVQWIALCDLGELFLTAVNEAELRYGIAILPSGRRKEDLWKAMDQWLSRGFYKRILPFDSLAATHFPEIASRRQLAGKPISEADCQIASITRSHGATLVTRNVSDFEGIDIEVVNPWTVEL